MICRAAQAGSSCVARSLTSGARFSVGGRQSFRMEEQQALNAARPPTDSFVRRKHCGTTSDEDSGRRRSGGGLNGFISRAGTQERSPPCPTCREFCC